MTKIINRNVVSYDRKIISDVKIDVDYYVFSGEVNVYLSNTDRKISSMFRKNEYYFKILNVKNMKDLRKKLRMNIYGGCGKCNSYLFTVCKYFLPYIYIKYLYIYMFRKLSEYIYLCIFNSFLIKRIGY